jgi:hypothetical protein
MLLLSFASSAARKAGHVQVMLNCSGPRHVQMLHQKADFIAAAQITDKTLVVPESVIAFEY